MAAIEAVGNSLSHRRISGVTPGYLIPADVVAKAGDDLVKIGIIPRGRKSYATLEKHLLRQDASDVVRNGFRMMPRDLARIVEDGLLAFEIVERHTNVFSTASRNISRAGIPLIPTSGALMTLRRT
jgi:hypothetical protein